MTINWADVASVAGQVLAAAATGYVSTGTWQGAAVAGLAVVTGLLQKRHTLTS